MTSARFVEAGGGCTTVLEPGETLYVPMLAWHHFEYLDDAMSVSVRFGRNRLARFLSLDHFHRDPFIQNVASTMTGPDTAREVVDPVVQEIMAVYERPAPDIEQKIREVRALFRRLAAQRCPDAHPADLCPPEREEEQIGVRGARPPGSAGRDEVCASGGNHAQPPGRARDRASALDHPRWHRALRIYRGRRAGGAGEPARQGGPRRAHQGRGPRRRSRTSPRRVPRGSGAGGSQHRHACCALLVRYGETNSVDSLVEARPYLDELVAVFGDRPVHDVHASGLHRFHRDVASSPAVAPLLALLDRKTQRWEAAYTLRAQGAVDCLQWESPHPVRALVEVFERPGFAPRRVLKLGCGDGVNAGLHGRAQGTR